MSLLVDPMTDQYAAALRDLRQAAGSPTIEAIVRQAAAQQPPVRLSRSSLHDYFNGKHVPSSAEVSAFLVVLLQARARVESPDFVPPPANWWEQTRLQALTERRRNRHRSASQPPEVRSALSPIADRYRLIERIGEGAMGRVWRARDEVLHRDVALKEILFPPGLSSSVRQQMSERLKREARSAARLSHPNIVTVHDVIERDGAPLLIMELVAGQSLKQVIQLAGRFTPERTVRLGIELATALQHTHAAGVIHRDVKPGNVLLAGARVILVDFGIAFLDGDPDVAISSAPRGTPAYMAPEQAREEPSTPASDLWSLGATLYAAVEGRPPYDGPTARAVLAALQSHPPRPPEHAGPLAALLDQLLQKNPNARATATRVVHDLARVNRPSWEHSTAPDRVEESTQIDTIPIDDTAVD